VIEEDVIADDVEDVEEPDVAVEAGVEVQETAVGRFVTPAALQ